MATTGTYAFNPSAADVVLNAFGMLQKRRTDLTYEMLENAGFQCNMLGIDFTNRNPNRWKMATVSIPMLLDTPSYTLDPQVVMIGIAYLDTIDSDGDVIATQVLSPFSAAEYAAQPNKLVSNKPNSYFFSLLSPNPTVTVWPLANAANTYILRLQVYTQQQDTRISGGYNIDTPYRFLDAFTWGLASRMVVYYPDPQRPSLAMDLGATFEAKFKLAAEMDQERVALKIRPNLSTYFPR
jgi:hypothetical protein